MTIKQHGGVFGRNPSFNDVSVETLAIAGTALASTADELNILDGVTADATELNYLDGVSASAVVASKAVLANASGNIAFPDGKGIDFSATGNGSGTTTSELFGDYEEGTWSPTYAAVGGAPIPTMTMANQFGRYVKVGNLVTVTALFDTSNVDITGVTSEFLTIIGLPFTNAASAWSAAHIASTGTWSTQVYSGVVPQSGARIDLLTRASTTAAPASATLSALSTGSNANHNQLIIAASYLIF